MSGWVMIRRSDGSGAGAIRDILPSPLCQQSAQAGHQGSEAALLGYRAFAYLKHYQSAQTLSSGALNGAILGNDVVSEIRKTYQNSAKECPFWYYRDKDGHEIDLLIGQDDMRNPIEIKRLANPSN
jgi:hypothetical protein